jgi:hypothetical protein
VIGTALTEEMGFESLASTEEKRGRRIMRIPPETPVLAEAGTAEPSWLVGYDIAQPVGCELTLGTYFLALQWVSGSTSWEERRGRRQPIGSRFADVSDAANRTACREESTPVASSTARSIGLVDLSSSVEAAFRAAQYETFRDGEESDFAKELALLVWQYGNSAVDDIGRLITSDHLDGEVASVALRTLGRLQHPLSHVSRLRLLERALTHQSSWVRDGAALGLASLGDPAAVVALQRAIAQEPIEELRQDMEAVEQHLETLG